MSTQTHSMTERLIRDADIVEGMRVLDLGCGGGAVTLLVADAVGPDGQVVGIDRTERVLEKARERASADQISQVEFVQGDLSGPLPELGQFDAIIGRRVLMYLPEPVETLRKVSSLLKDGGVIAFQEVDATLEAGCLQELPLHKKVNDWLWQTIEREGGTRNMGFLLPSVLQRAGFSVAELRAEGNIEGEKLHSPLATIVQAIVPRIVRHGVATEEEIELETLAQRLEAERAVDSVFIGSLNFTIWGHKLK